MAAIITPASIADFVAHYFNSNITVSVNNRNLSTKSIISNFTIGVWEESQYGTSWFKDLTKRILAKTAPSCERGHLVITLKIRDFRVPKVTEEGKINLQSFQSWIRPRQLNLYACTREEWSSSCLIYRQE